MKKIIYLVLLFTVLFQSKSFATVYTFTGTGNWSDVARWSPSIPTTTVESDSVIINGRCTITINDSINYLDQLLNANFVYFIINDTLVNNGKLINEGLFIVNSNGVFLNQGTFTPNGNFDSGGFFNYGLLINNNTINISPFPYFSYFYNYGTIENSAYIRGGDFSNYGVINSVQGQFESSTTDPPMDGPGYVTNTGTLNGSASIYRLKNTSNATLSPGYGLANTDTMNVYTSIYSTGSIKFDINSTADKDLIVLHNIENNVDSLGHIIVEMNPTFTPILTDTFVLFQSLGSAFSLLNAKFNITLPPPPSGYIWKVIKEQNRIYFMMDFGLPLPPENLKFLAVKNINSVDLNWEVTTIENVVRFEIEHSVTGMNFERIGTVNVASQLKFTYKDNKPNEGANYYRLKAIDQDGKYMYSNIELVNFSKTENEVLNTIVENVLNVYLVNSQQINIIDMSGKLVHSCILSEGNQSILLSHLTKGIYFLQTENGNYKFIKL